MDLEIREAQPADAQSLLAYMQELIREPGLDIPLAPDEFQMTVQEEEEFLRRLKTAENAVMFLAMSGREIVGEINLQGGTRQAMRHDAFLGMSVRKGWRGKGIGTRLMARAMEWAQGNPVVRRVELTVYARNAAAIHLYKKFDFKVEGRRRNKIFQEGRYLDDFVMARLV